MLGEAADLVEEPGLVDLLRCDAGMEEIFE
jgi:hypothetical protein